MFYLYMLVPANKTVSDCAVATRPSKQSLTAADSMSAFRPPPKIGNYLTFSVAFVPVQSLAAACGSRSPQKLYKKYARLPAISFLCIGGCPPFPNESKSKTMRTNLLTLLVLFACSLSAVGAGNDPQRIVTNPVDLNYRFMPGDPARREAADPCLVLFKDRYYLFASKSGGYWSSSDLTDWKYVKCTTLPVENYAPCAVAIGDTLYFMASVVADIYKNADPEKDQWEFASGNVTAMDINMTDPSLFYDDGRLFFYWGCSPSEPIMGIELDHKNNFMPIGRPVELIYHNEDKYGWEVQGHNNDSGDRGWNEGACINKHDGKYYLQYASPGTQFRIYADGVYVSDNPLGPYTCMDNSPYSFKPGGFMGGAGHGHTFLDKYGNYWHIATTVVSVREWFERRVGLFPVFFAANGRMFARTVFSDYPYAIPDRKVDFEKEDVWTGWFDLAQFKPVKVSSAAALEKPIYSFHKIDGFHSEKAVDGRIETWWSAATGDPGEWLEVDLLKEYPVNAIQVNFADMDFVSGAERVRPPYKYIVEASKDGRQWTTVFDRSDNARDEVHALLVPDEPFAARYLRITSKGKVEGKFSLYGFRVFGKGAGPVPAAPGRLAVRRDSDRRRVDISWAGQPGATGYILRWGIDPAQMYSATEIYENEATLRMLNTGNGYYFTVEAYNENGLSKKSETVYVE